jgi:hypothetical protein
VNWYSDWRFWLPVGSALFLLVGHLTYSALCPFFSSNAHSVCVISSQALIDLGSAGGQANAVLTDAGVP